MPKQADAVGIGHVIVSPEPNSSCVVRRACKYRVLMAFALVLALSAMLPAGGAAVDIKVLEGSDDKMVTILLSGQLVAGDALRVRSVIGGVTSRKMITMHVGFSGGLQSEAMSIGRFFNQTRIRTIIPAKTRCTSPCPLVLVGGRDSITGRPSYIKYSSAGLGFTGIKPNFPEKDYTAADLDTAVANTQRSILLVADYLRDVGADMNMLRYYQSVLQQDATQYITNEQALDLGIAVMFEETGQVIEPMKLRP